MVLKNSPAIAAPCLGLLLSFTRRASGPVAKWRKRAPRTAQHSSTHCTLHWRMRCGRPASRSRSRLRRATAGPPAAPGADAGVGPLRLRACSGSDRDAGWKSRPAWTSEGGGGVGGWWVGLEKRELPPLAAHFLQPWPSHPAASSPPRPLHTSLALGPSAGPNGRTAHARPLKAWRHCPIDVYSSCSACSMVPSCCVSGETLDHATVSVVRPLHGTKQALPGGALDAVEDRCGRVQPVLPAFQHQHRHERNHYRWV